MLWVGEYKIALAMGTIAWQQQVVDLQGELVVMDKSGAQGFQCFVGNLCLTPAMLTNEMMMAIAGFAVFVALAALFWRKQCCQARLVQAMQHPVNRRHIHGLLGSNAGGDLLGSHWPIHIA
jgi:hypothetical protein